MAEENKTEETLQSVVPTEDTKAEKKEVAILKLENKKLLTQLNALQEQLAAVPPHPDTGVIIAKGVVHPDQGVIISKGSKLTLASGNYEVVEIDGAWNIGQAVEKSYVEEDATCLVLKKS